MKAAAIVLLAMPMLLGAGKPDVPDIVLNCYVQQSSRLDLGSFVRHLRVQPSRGVVSVSDGIGGGAIRFLGEGRLVTFEPNRLAFDFASPTSSGRTDIDRRTGTFLYRDGRNAVRGTCQEGGDKS